MYCNTLTILGTQRRGKSVGKGSIYVTTTK